MLVVRVVSQEPDDNGGYHDDSTHLFEVLLSFFPRVAQYDFGGRHTVGRKLHHEGAVIAFHQELGEDAGHEYGQQDADGIDGQQNQTGFAGEECADHDQVDGKAGTA